MVRVGSDEENVACSVPKNEESEVIENEGRTRSFI
jgi:hypothetical protein